MRLEILGWIKSGASLVEGIRLFSLYSGNDHPFLRILQADPDRCLPILIQELASRAGLDLEEIAIRPKFREEWGFLNEPGCPNALKILAADKISSYHRYCRAHSLLFDCTSLEEQNKVAKELMANYLENQAITAEFRYYQEHGHVLGKHPIFKWEKEMTKLRKLGPIELMEFKIKLEHNIWRVQSELDKNDKPHLRTQREQRLRLKQMQLVEVQRMIADFSRMQ
jgi:hypothetical protein